MQCIEIFYSQQQVHLIGLLLYQMTRLNNFSTPEAANQALLQFGAALGKPEPFSTMGNRRTEVLLPLSLLAGMQAPPAHALLS